MDFSPSLLESSAILFDLDGTIIDSRPGIVGTIHTVLRELGHEPRLDEDLTWVVGPPLHDLIGEILSHYGDDRTELAVRLYREFYKTDGMYLSPVFNGMHEILQEFAATGARLFLATSKPVHLARTILDLRGLTSHFTELHGARPDDSGAEKPELIADLLRQHSIAPSSAMMIGDRRFDISGAHANKVRAIGVLWGYGGQEELEEAGAEDIVAVPSDLPASVCRHLEAESRHARLRSASAGGG